MKDNRKFTKQADTLMHSKKRIILRMQLRNGDIVERILSPVKDPSDDKHLMYNNIKNIYELKDKKKSTDVDLNNLDFSTLRRIGRGTLKPTSSKRGMVSSLVEVLLMSGYTVCDK